MKQSETQRKRLTSESTITAGHQGKAKLSKPPIVDTLHERTRKRLQKRGPVQSSMFTPYLTHLDFMMAASALYILEYEPYPYNTLPSQFLGAYTTVDSVTAGAIEHGAYTFSREGLLDGSEYLNATGRIKIRSHSVKRSGTEASVSFHSHDLVEGPMRQDEPVRLDIPHPNSPSNTMSILHLTAQSIKNSEKSKETVFLAIREGPTAAHCLGVCATTSLAWGACLKDKASCALLGNLSEENRVVDADGMPRTTARLHGCGQHTWFVVAREVIATARR